jgi:hypothetical protein
MSNIPTFKKYVKKIYDRSQYYVPVDKTPLKRSGKITTHDINDYEISYYAESPKGYNYAVIQHENLKFRHNFPERAKYLELAVDENITEAKKQYTEEILNWLKG